MLNWLPPDSGWSMGMGLPPQQQQTSAPSAPQGLRPREVTDLVALLQEAKTQLAGMDEKWGRANDAAILDKILTDKTLFTGDSPVRRQVDRLGMMAKKLFGPSAFTPAPAPARAPMPTRTGVRPPTASAPDLTNQGYTYIPEAGWVDKPFDQAKADQNIARQDAGRARLEAMFPGGIPQGLTRDTAGNIIRTSPEQYQQMDDQLRMAYTPEQLSGGLSPTYNSMQNMDMDYLQSIYNDQSYFDPPANNWSEPPQEEVFKRPSYDEEEEEVY